MNSKLSSFTLLILIITFSSLSALDLNNPFITPSFTFMLAETFEDLALNPFYTLPVQMSSESPTTYSFNLLPYSSTFFINNCSTNQNAFSCSGNSDCVDANVTANPATLPYFTLTGTVMSAPINVQNAIVYQETNIIYSNGCFSGNFSNSAYNNSLGFVGLSTNGKFFQALNQNYTAFSIYIAVDYSNINFGANGDAQFIAGIDSSKMRTNQFVVNLTTGISQNWEIPIDTIQLSTPYQLNGMAIFDPNVNFIGLPKALFQAVVSWLNSQYKMGCSNSTIFPSCTYSGSLTNLPTLNISTSNIPVPPSLYFQSGVLLFAGLDLTNSSGYIAVNSNYQNYIILGYPFMSFYYTVFQSNVTNPQITLYYSAFGGTVPVVYILTVVLMILVGVLLACACCAGLVWGVTVIRRKKVAKIQKDSIRTLNESHNMSALIDRRTASEDKNTA